MGIILRLATGCLAGSLLFGTWAVAAEETLSRPTGYVNDYAAVLPPAEKQAIEDRLSGYERATGNEIAVVTIKSLEGGGVEETALRYFDQWKIGKEKEDNGVLLLAAIDDRKMRIEVGYGLEPNLTDGEAGDIIRTKIAPKFAKNDYGGGVTDGTDAIIAQIGGAASDSRSQGGEEGDGIGSIFVAILFFGSYMLAFMARSKSIWLGGLGGGVIGGIFGFLVGGIVGLAIFGIIVALFGLMLDWLLSRTYARSGGRGGFLGSWGGFYGGGGSGGGFGGFGGGSSGGGGASGSW